MDDLNCRETNPKWVWRHEHRRESLDLSIQDTSIYTGRPGVSIAGLRQQGAEPNFLTDVLNCRLAQYMKGKSMSYTDPIPLDVWTDCREGMDHQRSNGGITLKRKSLAFVYHRQRSLCAREYLFAQGWGEDVKLDCIADPLPKATRDAWDDHRNLPRKKRRAQCRKPETVVIEMAGAGMFLFDVGLLDYSSLLAQETDLWEHPPVEEPLLVAPCNDLRINSLVVDPNRCEVLAGLEENQSDPAIDDMD